MSVLPPSVVDALSVDLKRQFLLQLETELAEFVRSPPPSEHQIPADVLPNSYFRLLLHQLCQHYRLRTWTNRAGGISLAYNHDVDYDTLLEVVETLEDLMRTLGFENPDHEGVFPPIIVPVPAHLASWTGGVHGGKRRGQSGWQNTRAFQNGRGNYRNRGQVSPQPSIAFATAGTGSFELGYGDMTLQQQAPSIITLESLPQRSNGGHSENESEIDSDKKAGVPNKKAEDSGENTETSEAESSTSNGSPRKNEQHHHHRFSPEAAPFFPSYPSYYYYGDPYYYPLYDKRTERQILNNPYIILPGDTKSRRKTAKRDA